MAISFPGAKHYKKHNGFSESESIKTPLPSPVHFYPLRQSKNILLKPIVNTGDYILRRQKIADLEAFSAIPSVSSVSGKVISVADDIIAVENDFLFDTEPYSPPLKSPEEMTSRELLWLIREAGVIENGVPAHVLLSRGKVPSSVIVCCFDSDPYISSPQIAAVGNAEKILSGLKLALRILCVKKAIIAVESTSKKTYSDFKYNIRYNKNIQLYSLKPYYPQSRRDILIKTLTGKSDDGISSLILSPETLLNIYNAVYEAKHVTEKIVTVSGDDILEASNFSVPIGMPVSALLSSAGYDSPQIVISGGVVHGDVITDIDMPVTGSSSAFAAFNDKDNIPKYRKQGLK